MTKEEIEVLKIEHSQSGKMLLLPNGLWAHFGFGSENVLKELFNKSLDSHVLPE